MQAFRGMVAIVLLAACGSEDDAAGTQQPALVCAPGKSEPCTGPAGCQGGQVCDDDGMGWGECMCAADGGGEAHDPNANKVEGACIEGTNCVGTCHDDNGTNTVDPVNGTPGCGPSVGWCEGFCVVPPP